MTKELILSLIPGASEEQADKFIKYYELLIEWNEKMNLTAITEEREVAEKHFADSLLPMELIPQNAKCIDVGTGAGFPGIPLMIMRPDITVTLLDSLNKRVTSRIRSIKVTLSPGVGSSASRFIAQKPSVR